MKLTEKHKLQINYKMFIDISPQENRLSLLINSIN